MAAESRDWWHHETNFGDILSLGDPQKFSYWSDVALYICNYDVITKAPMSLKKITHSPWGVLAACQVSFFFLGGVSEIEVQSLSVFSNMAAHHVTYDVIIISKTFYMNSRTDGENLVSIRQAVVEKNMKVLYGQTNKQTKQTDSM